MSNKRKIEYDTQYIRDHYRRMTLNLSYENDADILDLFETGKDMKVPAITIIRAAIRRAMKDEDFLPEIKRRLDMIEELKL